MHPATKLTIFKGLGKKTLEITSSSRKNWLAKVAGLEFTQVCNS